MASRKLLIGRAGTGKTRRLLDRVAEAAAGGRSGSCMLLVPTHSQAGHLKRLLISRYPEVTGFFDETIVTFTSLAEKIASGPTIRGLLSGLGQRLLTRRALLAMSLPHFRAVSRYPGFQRAAIEFLKEIKQNGLPGDEQRERLIEIAHSSSSPVKERILAFHQFYANYEDRRITLGLLDHEDFLAACRDRLVERPGPDLAYLGVDGFQNFTRLEGEILNHLSDRAIETEVTLTCDPDRPEEGRRQFRVSTETFRFLREHGFGVERLRANRRARNEILNRMEGALFGRVSAGLEPDPALRVLVASDPEDEADRVARTVRSLLIDGGFRRRDILIVVRDAPECRRRFESAFAHHAVPLRVFAPVSVAGHPWCRSALNLLNLVGCDFSRERVIGLLRSARIPGIEAVMVDRLEEDLDNRGEPAGAAGWVERVGTHSERGAEILGAFAETPETRTRRDWVKESRILLGECLVPRFDESLGDEGHIRAEAFAYRCFQSVLDDILDAGDEEVIGFPRFLGELEEALRATRFTPRDQRLDVVNLVDAREARQWEAAVVFVSGLTEGRFPRSPREDPFLMDRERRRVNEGGGLSVRERRHEQEEEIFLFYVAVTRARERLYLTRPSTDGSGEELAPSLPLTDLMAQFVDSGKSLVSERPLSRPLPLLAEIAWEEDLRRYALLGMSEFYAPASPGETRAGRAAALHNLLIGDPGYRSTTALAMRFQTPPPGRILDVDRLAERHPRGAAVSPTALEEYVACPFRHFVHRTLGIEAAPGLPREGVDARVLGSVAHRTLHLVMRRMVEGDGLPDPEEIRRIFFDAGHEVVGRGHLTMVERRDLDRTLEAVLRLVSVERDRLRTEACLPRHLEEWFGGEETPVSVRSDDGRTVRLRGCVDRIDVDPDGKAVVIDYKLTRGFDASARRAVEEGVRLQLPVYLLAARDAFGLDPVGAWLYSIRDATGGGYVVEGGPAPFKGMVKLTSTGLLEMLESLSERVLDIDAGIRSGRIDIEPREDACEFCDYGDLCRVERWRLREDPR